MPLSTFAVLLCFSTLGAMWRIAIADTAVFNLAEAKQNASAVEWYGCTSHLRKQDALPKSKCPRTFPKYAIVAPDSGHELHWMSMLGDDVEPMPYQDRDPTKPHYFHYGGQEAGAYLQFIIDYYDCLPEAVAFVHGHEIDKWHNLPMLPTMRALNWSAIPGYTDLNRKMPTWKWIIRDIPRVPPPPAIPIAYGAEAYSGPYHPYQIIQGNAYTEDEAFWHAQSEATARSYDKFFGPMGLGPMPDVISFVCCAQFAATKERLRLRSREFWHASLQYMLHNDIYTTDEPRFRAHLMGDVFTLTWAMLLGEGPDYERTVDDSVLFPPEERPLRRHLKRNHSQ